MNSHAFLAHADEFVLQFIFWTSIAVPAISSWFWPWWKTALGWAVTSEAACLAVVALPSDLTLEFGINTNDLFWQWWVAATFFLAGIRQVWLLGVLWRYQRRVNEESANRLRRS